MKARKIKGKSKKGHPLLNLLLEEERKSVSKKNLKQIVDGVTEKIETQSKMQSWIGRRYRFGDKFLTLTQVFDDSCELKFAADHGEFFMTCSVIQFLDDLASGTLEIISDKEKAA